MNSDVLGIIVCIVATVSFLSTYFILTWHRNLRTMWIRSQIEAFVKLVNEQGVDSVTVNNALNHAIMTDSELGANLSVVIEYKKRGWKVP